MIFKLSYLNSNSALTLGYLNPALNNSAQFITPIREYGQVNIPHLYHYLSFSQDGSS